jgi:hypothetical protein
MLIMLWTNFETPKMLKTFPNVEYIHSSAKTFFEEKRHVVNAKDKSL